MFEVDPEPYPLDIEDHNVAETFRGWVFFSISQELDKFFSKKFMNVQHFLSSLNYREGY